MENKDSIFEDDKQSKLTFHGSTNETGQALMYNDEAISTSYTWDEVDWKRNGMEWVDKTCWSDGKIEGDVYRKMVKGSLDMFFSTA